MRHRGRITPTHSAKCLRRQGLGAARRLVHEILATVFPGLVDHSLPRNTCVARDAYSRFLCLLERGVIRDLDPDLFMRRTKPHRIHVCSLTCDLICTEPPKINAAGLRLYDATIAPLRCMPTVGGFSSMNQLISDLIRDGTFCRSARENKNTSFRDARHIQCAQNNASSDMKVTLWILVDNFILAAQHAANDSG